MKNNRMNKIYNFNFYVDFLCRISVQMHVNITSLYNEYTKTNTQKHLIN